jgi:large subunit ribosomal protein L21
MYAIVRTGGKQYTVRAGDSLRVEKLPRELGAEFELDEILLVGGDKIHVGEPTVKNAKVTVVVTQQARAPKLIVFKKKRRQGYRRLHGHRQFFTELFVKSIQAPGGELSEASSEAQIVDPAKKAARLAKLAEQANTPEAKIAKKEARKTAAPKAAKAKSKPAAKKKSSGAKKSATTKKKAAK